MYWEVNARHHTAHFHAYYQNAVVVYSIDPVEILAGEIPRKQARLVEAWAELHQKELAADWNRLQAGRGALPIDPLR